MFCLTGFCLCRVSGSTLANKAMKAMKRTLYIATDSIGTAIYWDKPVRTNYGFWDGTQAKHLECMVEDDMHQIAEGQSYEDEPIEIDVEIKIQRHGNGD